MKSIGVQLFEKIIVGKFDNAEQIEKQIANGHQTHPFAIHVTDLAFDKVNNIPKQFNGSLILEESYYDFPDGENKIKPLFFRVTPFGNYNIFLESLVIPKKYDPQEVVNENEHLVFDYAELHPNEGFGKAQYLNMGDHFVVDHHCNLTGGIRFNLVETLTYDALHVLELAFKEDAQLTPYNDPIIYKRKI